MSVHDQWHSKVTEGKKGISGRDGRHPAVAVHIMCEVSTNHDVAEEYYMNVPAHTLAPARPTMLSELHESQTADELKLLFGTPNSIEVQPSAVALMETFLEPASADCGQPIGVNDVPKMYVDKRKEYDGQTEKDPIR